ncbi:MAG: hypothetical protein Q8N67_05555 [Candidatus Omnitrophota bacterium]|nr:hypothetical protein [Candidatus Omnitrophota bacterium]
MLPGSADLILVSLLSLFLELCFIRWIPAHIFSVAFFSNIILISSFLGLGTGLLLSKKKYDLFPGFSIALSIGVFIIIFSKNIFVYIPPDAQTWLWSYYGGNRFYLPSFKMPIVFVLGIVFSLETIIFIPVGQKIGKLMAGLSPISGYTSNIIGSLLGVICFGAASFFQAPAYIWFLIVLVLVAAVLYRKRAFIPSVFILAGISIFILMQERNILWSPYYSIQLVKDENKSVSVYVNQSFHQKAVNFDKDAAALEKYTFPYRWIHPQNVLIIGAGTGNDVSAALRAGVKKIDAVEIDPLIMKIGLREHPQSPYQSEKVRVFIDDARSFMRKSKGGYDMIVYGTLDSHAVLSTTSSVRLDSYVYTREALQETSRLLSSEGVIVLLFSVPTEWMKDKLLETVRYVFKDEARYILWDPYLFNLMVFAGPGLNSALSLHPDLAKVLTVLPDKSDIEISKDDWPYLYLKKRGIPGLYLSMLLMLSSISLVFIFMLSPFKGAKLDIFFLLLGCGFLLLETKSVTTLSLFFGSTWIVNAVVFSAILFIALLANWFVTKKDPEKIQGFFAALGLSLVASYFFPLSSLLKLGFLAKILGAGLLAGLPIFFAAVIFASVFKRTKYPGIALGSNLVGAVVGGFCEYISMVSGLKFLYILALIFYISAWIIYSFKKQAL